VRKNVTKEKKAWAIASGAIVLIWSADFTRKDCVKGFEDHTGEQWDELKTRGYRICKIQFYEVCT